MRTVQVARRFTGAKWGGTETVILETGRRLQSRGQEVEIWSSDALSHPGSEVFRGVPVRRFPYFYPYLGLSNTAREQLDLKGGNLVSFDLHRALRLDTGIDLLHLHTGKRLGGLCRSVAQKRRIPYVVSLHGGVFDVPAEEAATWTEPTRGTLEWGRALGWWFGSRRVLEDADAVICVGGREATMASRCLPDTRVEHMPNGVDTRRFEVGDGESFRAAWGIDRQSRVLLVVGRIDAQKNQVEAVRVLESLLAEDPRWHLVLAGPVTDEPYGLRLRQLIESHGLDRQVTLTGSLDPEGEMLRDAFHAADIFMLPSRHEPFGIVVLEAWAAGVPVVASKVGGLGALISDTNDGLLVGVEDRRAWLEAIRSLAASEDQRRAMTIRARERCRKEFDWEVITTRLTDLYESVQQERCRPAPRKALRR